MTTRRDFLQKLVMPLVALPVLTEDNRFRIQAGYNDGPVLRVAIMGLGSYSTRVAEAMKDCNRARMFGAISGTPAKIADWQQKFGIPKKNCYNYENFDNIKNNPDIDAVYIITTNALYKDQALRVAGPASM